MEMCQRGRTLLLVMGDTHSHSVETILWQRRMLRLFFTQNVSKMAGALIHNSSLDWHF